MTDVIDLTVNSTSVIAFSYPIHWDADDVDDIFEFYIGNLRIADDSILKIGSIRDVVSFVVWDTAENREALSRTAIISRNGALMKPKWTLHSGQWFLFPFSNEPWTPVPEVSTYGAVFSFSGLALGLIRRRKKRRTHLITADGVRV